MIVECWGNIEHAIRLLSRKVTADGIGRELKVHQIAKSSDKKKYKLFLVNRRRLKELGKRVRAESVRNYHKGNT